MIVEGVLIVGVAYKLFVAPIRSTIVASKLLEAKLEQVEAAPRLIVMEDAAGEQFEFPAADFFDDDGEKHTDFLVGTVLNKEGEKHEVVLSRAEVELMQIVSFVEAQLKEDKPVSKEALQSICGSIKERRDEVTRSPNRRVTRPKRRKAA